MTVKDERLDQYDVDPDERAFARQPRGRPLLHAASSLVVLELSPKSYHDDIDTTYQKGPSRATPNSQLRVSVRWAVLLLAAVLIVSALGTGLFFCSGEGIHLGSLSSSDKTDAKKALLDKLNGQAGSFVAAVLIPLELVVIMIMSVCCLCFATDWMLRRGVNDLLASSMPTIVAGIVMYLLSNGLSALNVQLVSRGYHVKISAEDLAVSDTDDQAVAVNGSLATAWNTSFAEKSANNSVLNTILRTKLIPFEDVQPTCKDQLFSFVRPPTLSFGFPSRLWQQETLQTALAPEQTIDFSLVEASLPSDDELPMSSANATYLAVAATQVLPDLLGPLWEVDLLLDSEEQSVEDISANDFISTSTSVLRDLLQASPNVSVDGVRIGYKHLAISESVVVDTLTLVVPTKPVEDNDLEVYCTEDGCVAGGYFFGNDNIKIQPGVYAAAVCINEDGTEDFRDESFLTCTNRSNSSMLLVGVGKQIVGPTWKYRMDEDDGNEYLDARDVTMTYSVTVARISWVIENFTDVFSAECDNGDGCNGTRTPLDPSGRSSSDVLVVGEAALPLGQLEYFGAGSTNWKELINLSPSVVFQTDDYNTDGDLVLPRRFSVIAEEGEELRGMDRSTCNAITDKYIKVVEKNHLYAEESLQMTYTAGFFFLFQNAVQHSPENTTSSLLAFAGNTQKLHIQASIPTLNIYVSICGCVILLAMSVGVVIVQNKSTDTLEQAANADIVAEALLNTAKYPRLFLDMALRPDEAELTHNAGKNAYRSRRVRKKADAD